jgi:hypothetical protein
MNQSLIFSADENEKLYFELLLDRIRLNNAICTYDYKIELYDNYGNYLTEGTGNSNKKLITVNTNQLEFVSTNLSKNLSEKYMTYFTTEIPNTFNSLAIIEPSTRSSQSGSGPAPPQTNNRIITRQNTIPTTTNTSSNPTNASGNSPNSSGNPNNASGNPPNSSGNPTNASGNPTNSNGNPPNSSGNPTNQSGYPTNPSGNPTNSSGLTQPSIIRQLNKEELVLDKILGQLPNYTSLMPNQGTSKYSNLKGLTSYYSPKIYIN